MASTRSLAAGGEVFVRRDIGRLSSSGPEIAALKRGIAAMQARADSVPTSWIYQANVHGTEDPGSLPGWNSCPHGSFFFLSWHRMYLYWFERILRAASGEPTLALPYWNYASSTQRALPRVFRTPAGASNPLYVAERDRRMNQGSQLFPSDVSSDIAFRAVDFSSPRTSGVSFGGQRLRTPDQFARPPGQLESQPHNLIHGKVGGTRGFMSYVTFAARDPIFWLHHANIDRLWKRWLDQGGGRSNPGRTPDEQGWYTHPFVFFDEGGNRVSMTGQDIVDTVGQLNYRYDDDPSEPARTGFTPEVTARLEPTIPLGETMTPQPPSILRGTSREGVIDLSAARVTVPIDMEPRTASFEMAHTPAGAWADQRPLVLNLEGIRYEQNPGVSYEVYLNLPKGRKPSHKSPYYVGSLGFFPMSRAGGEHGAHPHAGGEHGADPHAGARNFDITANVRALQERGEWQGQPAQVTFILRGLLPPATKARTPPSRAGAKKRTTSKVVAARAAAPALPGSPVTIDRVSITTE